MIPDNFENAQVNIKASAFYLLSLFATKYILVFKMFRCKRVCSNLTSKCCSADTHKVDIKWHPPVSLAHGRHWNV